MTVQSTIYDGMTPTFFDLPSKFTEFRPAQLQALEFAVYDAVERFIALGLPTGSGKSLLAVAIAKAIGTKAVYLTATRALQDQVCVAPETRLLTGDLRWTPAGSVNTGEILAGFDEYPNPVRRKWRKAVVEAVGIVSKPSCRLTFSDGTSVVCSNDHLWLTKTQAGFTEWQRTSRMRVDGRCASNAVRIVDIWNERRDYDSGYLAAAFDGEGHLHQKMFQRGILGEVADVNLGFAQVFNDMLAEVMRLLDKHGFSYSFSSRSLSDRGWKDSVHLTINHRRDVMRFLGEMRPHRLLPKVDLDCFGMIGPSRRVKLVKREDVGVRQLCAIRTSTHTFVAEGLASHNCNDFAESGMVDVRGRANYSCGQLYPGVRNASCEYGHQHECSLEHSPACGYDAAVSRARASRLVVTNYSYWMHARRYDKNALASDDEPVGLLICDEAGEIPELVSDFVSIKISFDDEELPYSQPSRAARDLESGIMPSETWTTWARERRASALQQLSRLRESYATAADAARDDRAIYLKELLSICDRIPTLDSNWVWEVDRAGVKFQPIWPGASASALWSGVPRVLLMSATLRPYTLALCGLPKTAYSFREWPAVFLPQLGPVYHLPTVKLSWKSTDEDYKLILDALDCLLSARNDRKGIVHTVSYARARRVLAHSRHAARFIWNEDGRSANAANERFRNAGSNSVLVSPSFSTGFDFPGELCEFQAILKVPYPDTSSRVMTERCKAGDYRMYSAVQDLVQMCGRGRRYPSDRCETFIFDDGVKWAAGGPRNPWHGHAPSWFKLQSISAIPPAPPRVKG